MGRFADRLTLLQTRPMHEILLLLLVLAAGIALAMAWRVGQPIARAIPAARTRMSRRVSCMGRVCRSVIRSANRHMAVLRKHALCFDSVGHAT